MKEHELSLRQDASVISLFTGAGGLDLGLESAGFDVCACVEIDDHCRKTIKLNRPDWLLLEQGDIHEIAPEQLLAEAGRRPGEVKLLAGGPPCQPFSMSANWANRRRGLNDPRARTLNAYLDVVEAVQPQVLLLENVRGIATGGERSGVELLSEGVRRLNETLGTAYNPQVIHLNAAEYGVPQRRERLFVVATIDGRQLELPPPTHGQDPGMSAIRTTWDAIGDLDADVWPEELALKGKWAQLLPSIPEGHNYLWHTSSGGGEPLFGHRTRYWSFLLKLAKTLPSWTIQAAPGPATGPFHWRNRMLSTRELARLQTFPDSYEFVGDRRSAHRQVGNAVPCALAELLGLEIRRQLLGHEHLPAGGSFVPQRRLPVPEPQPTQPVEQQFLSMRGEHAPHPGVGKGPGRARPVRSTD